MARNACFRNYHCEPGYEATDDAESKCTIRMRHCGQMASIPQGAFAACKVRYNEEQALLRSAMKGKEKAGKENMFNLRSFLEGWELTPLKYNSKLMNSIWGLYNRYSVHNFKKNTDAEEGAHGGVAVAIWGAILENHPPAANAAARSESPQIMRTGNGL